MQTLLTVNILCYNAEKNIISTIKSIAKIRNKNIKIVIFDDCSQDKSVKTVEQLKKNDSRIFLIKNKKNIGVGNLRNLALKKTNSKYVMYVDAGDIVIYQSLKILIKRLEGKKNNFDFGIVNFTSEKPEHKCMKFNGKIINSVNLIKQIEKKNIENFRTVSWRYIVLSSFIKKKNIRFTANNRKIEDVEFISGIISKAKKIFNFNINLVHQKFYKNSLTETSGAKIKFTDLYYAWNAGKNILNNAKIADKEIFNFNCKLIKKMIDPHLPSVLFFSLADMKKIYSLSIRKKILKNNLDKENEFIISIFNKPKLEFELLKNKYLDYLKKKITKKNNLIIYCYSFWSTVLCKYLLRKKIKIKNILDSNKLFNNSFQEDLNLNIFSPSVFFKKNKNIKELNFYIIHRSKYIYYEIKDNLVKFGVNKKKIIYINFNDIFFKL